MAFEDILQSTSSEQNHTDNFETSFAVHVGARAAFGLSSGRACLRFGLELLDTVPNFEVIIPTFVCGAVADAVIAAGGTPVLCDVKATDGTIDPSKIRSCISEKTIAIVAVHYQGLPCDIDEILEIGEENGVPVIEDCAHAIGSKFAGRPLGTFGSFAIYSFSVDKPMTTGNGGIITTNSTENQEKMLLKMKTLNSPSKADELHVLKLLLEINLLSNERTYGLSSFTYFPAMNFSLASLGFKPNYVMQAMTRTASRVGVRQLKLMDWFIQARTSKANELRESLANSRKIRTYENSKLKEPVFLRYTILTDSPSSRERLMRQLKRAGIEAGPINWRLPLHFLPQYSENCVRGTSFEGADEFSSRFLNLPCHPFVSEDNITKIGKYANSL
ncbi:MAG: DegT/DnrJ/EryC1/StrS family aminotransferase [Thaumarchaeota archaeon]|nr:DegT/DnrJ/EryC1/StrS family aminotransferase [Nitrososphaerota archaeon]